MSRPEIRPFKSTDTDWLTQQHQQLYTQDEGFDQTFGPLVRSILEAYVADHDPSCEAGWVAQDDDIRVGSIFCVRHSVSTAKLRLFLLTPEARGHGIGRRLLQTCMGFAKGAGYQGMTLWTHESHKAACALYEKTGWRCVDSVPVHSFGQDLVEQTWVIDFKPALRGLGAGSRCANN